ILEGLATIIASLISASLLPPDISSAKFLTEEERDFALKRLLASDVTIFTGPSIQQLQSQSTSMDKGSMDIVSNSPTITNGYYDKKDVEPLETREIVRGSVALELLSISVTFINYDNLTGLTDIQTWLTGIAYLGLVVSLYSYSLFLYVQPFLVKYLFNRNHKGQQLLAD
ncbi:hypothetical protein C0993_008017, partial [Termitomyces sp. T159_Od127]